MFQESEPAGSGLDQHFVSKQHWHARHLAVTAGWDSCRKGFQHKLPIAADDTKLLSRATYVEQDQISGWIPTDEETLGIAQGVACLG